jgi:hypothetical protein
MRWKIGTKRGQAYQGGFDFPLGLGFSCILLCCTCQSRSLDDPEQFFSFKQTFGPFHLIGKQIDQLLG